MTAATTLRTPLIAVKTFTASGGKYITTLEFEIDDDEVKEEVGSITVYLLTKTDNTGSYRIPASPSASVNVYDDEVPALSIAGVGNATEGPNAVATFAISSPYELTKSILFRYRPDDGISNFLTGTTAGNPQIGRLDFNASTTAMLEVPIYDDNITEEIGKVSVELLGEGNGIFHYTVAPAPANKATVTVHDNDAPALNDIKSVSLHTEPMTPISSQLGIAQVDYYVKADSAVTKDLEITYEYIYGFAGLSQNSGQTTPGFNADDSDQWTRGIATIRAGDTTGRFTITMQTFFGNNITVRLVNGGNYNLGTPSQQNLPAQTLTTSNPLVSIDVVGDRRILEQPDLVYKRDPITGNLVRDPVTGAVMVDTTHTNFKSKFIVSANPAPSSNNPITINVNFTQDESYISEALTNNILTKTVTLTDRQTSAEIEVEFATNTTKDGDGKITAEIQSGTGYQLGNYTNTTSITIVDDESLPTLTINDPTPVSESIGTATFKITADSEPSINPLRVHYGLREPTGDFLVFDAPSYLPLPLRVYADSQIINFTPEAGNTGNFVADLLIDLEDDEIIEIDGTVSVTLVGGTDFTYKVITDSNDVGIAPITDDDQATLTITDATAVEGADTETPKMVFTVTADPIATTQLSATWTTSDDTSDVGATGNTDYTSASGIVRIPANTATGTFEVEILGDDTPEFHETFTVTLSNPSSDALISNAAGSAIGTITNDDNTGLRIEAVTVDEGAAGETPNMVFTVTTVPPSDSPITYSWRTLTRRDDTATAGADYTASRGTDVEIAANAPSDTFTVPLIGDDSFELDETFTISLFDVTGATILTPLIKGTINDDDGALLSVANSTLVEGANGETGKMIFTVTAAPPFDEAITATWTTSVESDDDATSDTDFTHATGTVTIPANSPTGTFEVDILGDATPEFHETFTVTLSNPSQRSRISDTEGSAKGTITNDDGTGLRIDAVSLNEGVDGDSTNMEFTVTTVPPINSPITYSWTTSKEIDDDAIVDTDYTAASGTNVTIAANATSDTILVPILGDDNPELDETFTITLSNVTGAILLNTTVKGTISNDDGIGLSLADASILEGADPITSKLQFTVSAFPPSSEEITATWATSVAVGDNATADTDYKEATDTVTIAANQPTATFEIDIVGDNTPEFDETFTVTLSNPSGDGVLIDGIATGTITNDDGTGLNIEAVSLNEGVAGSTTNMEFVVTTVPPASSPIDYTWATSIESGDSATAGTDFTTSGDTETIAANAPSDTISVPIIGDNDPEENETFTITLSNPSGATLMTTSVQGTITNDDGTILSIADATLVEGAAGANKKMQFIVSTFPTISTELTATWTTADETGDDTDLYATAGTDYTTATDTVRIAPDTQSTTIEVDIVGDDTPEFDESFTVTLSNPSADTQISTSNGSAKGTISNDDGTGLRIEGVSLAEGADNANTNMEFIVSTVPPSSSNITYDWATSIEAGDTATANTDYSTSSDSNVVINASAPSDTFSVPIIGDNVPEDHETFTVTLSNPSGATLLTTSVQGTITNDDGSGLSIANATLVEGAARATGKLQFTVTAFPTPESELTATWTTEDETGDDTDLYATAGTDYTTATGQVRIAANTTTDTFEIDIKGDDTPEFDETFVVTLSSPSAGASIFTNAGSAQGTITNDDGTGLRIEAVELAEGANNESSDMTFTVTTVPPSTAQITYDWTTSTESDDVAVAGTDYTTSGATGVNIAANATEDTFTVPITGDNDPEPSETFTVTLSNVTGAELLVPSVKGTILNDDGSNLTIANVSEMESDNGTAKKIQFTVTADPPAVQRFTVDWATSIEVGDTATEDTDYTGASGDLTFEVGDDEETFEIDILDDNTPEFNETFTVTLSNAGAGAVLSADNATAQGTIENDDGTGLSIEAVSLNEGATGDTTNMEFKVITVPPSENSITYSWTATKEADDDAIAGADFTAVSGTDITIAANAVSDTISVPIISDNDPEADETFTITLTSATGAEILVSSVKGTITNDDGSLLTIADATLAEGADGVTDKMQFTVTAFPAPDAEITATWTTADETGSETDKYATAGTDYMTATGVISIAANTTTDTFEIDIEGDDVPEFDETFVVSLSAPSTGAKISTSKGSAKGKITNDDGTGLSIEAVSMNEGARDSNTDMTFTVTTIPPSSSQITFDWQASSTGTEIDDALAGVDYTALSVTGVEISANAESKTITVPIIGDDDPEYDETFTVSLTSATGASILVNSVQGTITNDDGTELRIANTTLPEGAKDSTSKMRFTVTAIPPNNSGFSATWTTSNTANDKAVDGEDFTSTSGTVNILPDAETGTFEVTIIGDDIPEFDETFTATLSNPSAGAQISSSQGAATGIINNDDGTGLSIEAVTLDEGVNNATTNMEFVVSTVPPSSSPITYSWTTSNAADDEAIAGTDYNTSSGTNVPIAANAESDTIRVPIIGDSTPEFDETFTITLSNPTGATLLVTSVKGTIANDDGTGLSIGAVSMNEGTDGATTNMEFTVSTVPPSDSQITYNWNAASQSGDTALAGSDYTAVSGNNVPIAANATSDTISVPILGDIIPELDETFTLTLTNPTGATLLVTSVLGTITNDDIAPVLSVGDGTAVTEASGAMAMFPITSDRVAKMVTVYYTPTQTGDFLDSSVTAGTKTTKTLDFAGGTSATLSVPITNDELDEVNGSITITLANDENMDHGQLVQTYTVAAAPNNDGTVTVNDDDVPQLSIAAVNANVDEAPNANARFTISANKGPISGFKFRYSVMQAGNFLATSVDTANPILGSPSFTGSGNTYTTPLNLPIHDDGIAEATGSVTVELLAKNQTSSDYTLGSNKSVKVTIYDDDASQLSIASVGGPVIEGSGNKATFTITSRINLPNNFRVRFQPNDGLVGNFLAGGIADNPQERNLNFNNTKTATLELDIVDDNTVEEDGTIQVALLADDANPIKYTVASAPANRASVAVQDNDTLATPPMVSLTTDFIPSGSTTATYYVTVPAAQTSDVEVIVEYNYGITDPNTNAITYSLTTWRKKVATITAGETFGSFTVNTTVSSQGATGSSGSPQLMVRVVDGANYNLSAQSSAGPPTLATSDKPLVTISPVGDGRVVESGELKFEVTASPTPTSAFEVTVHVTQDGDFIKETLNSGVLTKPVNVPTTGSVEFTVGLNDDGNTEPNGTITATVQPDNTKYVIGNFSKTTSANIFDDDALTVLTIADTGPILENAGPANFTITSTATSDIDLTVQYRIAEENGDFLNLQTLENSDLFEFRSNGTNYVATLPVNLHNDITSEATGSISVTLVSDTTYPFSYKVGTASKGTAVIYDNDLLLPELSITYAETETLAGNEAKFVVASSTPYTGDLTITYQPVKSGGNFLDESNGPNGEDWSSTRNRTETITFTQAGSDYTAPLTIATIDDVADTDGGTIAVTLQSDPILLDTYTLSSNANAVITTATVIKVPVPELTIPTSLAAIAVNEGETATITVEANEDPKRELTFHHVPTETGTSYLKVVNSKGSSDSRSVQKTFVNDPLKPDEKWRATFDVETNSPDSLVNTTGGTISIALGAPEGGDKFTIGSDHTATISITDGDIPSSTTPQITLSAPNYIAEGDSFNLVATASPAPTSLKTIDVNLTSDENNNFLASGSRGPLQIEIQPNETTGCSQLPRKPMVPRTIVA